MTTAAMIVIGVTSATIAVGAVLLVALAMRKRDYAQTGGEANGLAARGPDEVRTD